MGLRGMAWVAICTGPEACPVSVLGSRPLGGGEGLAGVCGGVLASKEKLDKY